MKSRAGIAFACAVLMSCSVSVVVLMVSPCGVMKNPARGGAGCGSAMRLGRLPHEADDARVLVGATNERERVLGLGFGTAGVIRRFLDRAQHGLALGRTLLQRG